MAESEKERKAREKREAKLRRELAAEAKRLAEQAKKDALAKIRERTRAAETGNGKKKKKGK